MSILGQKPVGERLFQHASWDERIHDYAAMRYNDVVDDIDAALDAATQGAMQANVHMGFIDFDTTDVDDLSDNEYLDVVHSAYKIVLTNLRAACMQRIQLLNDRDADVNRHEVDLILGSYDKLHGRVLRAYNEDKDQHPRYKGLHSYNIGFDEACGLN